MDKQQGYDPDRQSLPALAFVAGCVIVMPGLPFMIVAFWFFSLSHSLDEELTR